MPVTSQTMSPTSSAITPGFDGLSSGTSWSARRAGAQRAGQGGAEGADQERQGRRPAVADTLDREQEHHGPDERYDASGGDVRAHIAAHADVDGARGAAHRLRAAVQPRDARME